MAVEVYTQSGERVVQDADGTMNPGAHQRSVSLTHLASGAYMIRVRIDDQTRTFPLIHR